MDNNLRNQLISLNIKCQKLVSHGHYVDCIAIMEQIVSIKKKIYGIDHEEFRHSSEKLCQYLNLAGMICLQKQKFQESLDFLKKAEILSRDSLLYKSTTYNNLACYYRRTGKNRTALTYLIQALSLELKMEHPKTLPDTHLNICAVLSQLDRHEDTLQHVMLSIILLQDQFLKNALPYIQQSQSPISDERLAILTIAYHNLGVQFEFLNRFEQAIKIYNKALNISVQYLSNNKGLINNLIKVVESASNQMIDGNRTYLEQKKKKLQRQTSETKKDFYKEISKQAQKSHRNGDKQLRQNMSVNISYDNKKQQVLQDIQKKKQDRNFISRKYPRIYKSSQATPQSHTQSLIHGYRNSKKSQIADLPHPHFS